MAKNLVSGPILAHLTHIWAPIFFFFFHRFYLLLDIVASYHCMQFQGELMNLT